MRRLLLLLCAGLAALARGAELLPVDGIEAQPFFAQVRRLIEAADNLGTPIAPADKTAIEHAMTSADSAAAIQRVQQLLDGYCLFAVGINPEMRVKVARGPARPELVEQGWRQFLVKVHNEAGATTPLRVSSPESKQVFARAGAKPPDNSPPLAERWLDAHFHTVQPLQPTLSGLALEYLLLELYSRDAGKREAKFSFDIGQGTQDAGFRGEADVLFTCQTARELTLHILDENSQPTTVSLLIRDPAGRVHPSQIKRVAPDFYFHPQVYRSDGEKLRLPDGTYTVECSRGPESVPEMRQVEVSAETRDLAFQIQRWIDPAKLGWWSGDHHIHAAGCAHYTRPTEGVHAPDMARHCQGEDLKVGANLTWGPCFDYQKQFFTGKEDKVSSYPYLLRYDVEVSGFGSHRSGHLCLLHLRDQMYPGGDSTAHWPTLCLNTLRWAKAQGALCGPAHSGWGLKVDGAALPSYQVPPFDGIGANEYIVDVTHQLPGPDGKLVPAVDFLSTVDTPSVWELNIWYHTLNAGFRTRISGETDFPCIYGERVGLGRSYVKLAGKLTYDDWCEAIRRGSNYVSDGRSHLLDFKVGDVAMGEKQSELSLTHPGSVKVTARVAARLNEKPDPAMPHRPLDQKPYWDIERARIGDSREVALEVIVNGYPVSRRNVVADGQLRDVTFDIPIERSSWVALRILPSSHSNPVFVLVDEQPIRASRRSAQWCLSGVDQCRSQKEKLIAPAELEDARAAYEHARKAYRKILAECKAE